MKSTWRFCAKAPKKSIQPQCGENSRRFQRTFGFSYARTGESHCCYLFLPFSEMPNYCNPLPLPGFARCLEMCYIYRHIHLQTNKTPGQMYKLRPCVTAASPTPGVAIFISKRGSVAPHIKRYHYFPSFIYLRAAFYIIFDIIPHRREQQKKGQYLSSEKYCPFLHLSSSFGITYRMSITARS